MAMMFLSSATFHNTFTGTVLKIYTISKYYWTILDLKSAPSPWNLFSPFP
jgi:hypothetical protein